MNKLIVLVIIVLTALLSVGVLPAYAVSCGQFENYFGFTHCGFQGCGDPYSYQWPQQACQACEAAACGIDYWWSCADYLDGSYGGYGYCYTLPGWQQDDCFYCAARARDSQGPYNTYAYNAVFYADYQCGSVLPYC